MTRMSIDELARRHRLLKAARIRSIASALDASPAILLTDRDGRRWLAIVSPDLDDQRKLRVTRLASDGPLGHNVRANRSEIVEAIADYYPASARPATEAEVLEWTNTAEYLEGSKRVEAVQRWNAGFRD